jgi:hypothetical protein
LEVIIQSKFVLPANLDVVLATDHRELGTYIVLRVVISDGTVALRVANIIRQVSCLAECCKLRASPGWLGRSH